jgi:serine/threonine-protein kinase
LNDAAFDTLTFLVEHAGEVVTREALLAAVWAGRTVVDNSANQAVAAVRRVLGDDPAAPRYVASVTGRGYRFAAAVAETDRAARDPEAFQHYVAGWSTLTRPGRGNLKTAQAQFERAIAKDPTFALAHACLAECHMLQGGHGVLSPHEAYPPAVASARAALAIDPDCAEAYAILSHLASSYDYDIAEADRFMQRALELDPECFMAHRFHAVQLSSLGRFEEALAAARRAQAIEPLAASINGNIAMILFLAGRNEEAIAQFDHTLQLDSRWVSAHGMSSVCHAELGDFDRAWERLRHPDAHPLESAWITALVLAMEGRTEEARRRLERLMQPADGEFVRPFDAALVHSALGDTDAALAYIDQVIDQRMNAMVLAIFPAFRPLHADARFKARLERLGIGHLEPVPARPI